MSLFDPFFSGDDLSDLFFPVSANWNRLFNEKTGYQLYSTKTGMIVVFNTLGVSKEDLAVKHTTDRHGNLLLSVKGSTNISELGNKAYDCSYELAFTHADSIEKIEYTVKNGLTLVYLKSKEAAKPDIDDAKFIDDASKANW